ncbi:MAG: polysaccharide biosynthesis/export family protein [Cyanobacteria bacterium J06650_10]
MFSSRAIKIFSLSIAGGLLLSGPSVANDIANSRAEDDIESGLPSLNQPQTPDRGAPQTLNGVSPNTSRLSAIGSVVARRPLPLSPGDRLRISIPGIGAEDFNGVYEVNLSGDLELPYVAPLAAVGFTPEALEQQVESTLINQQIFRPGLLTVSVQVLDYSPVQVSVTGAVFEPGRLLVSGDEDTPTADGEAIDISGDYPVERYLTSTLLAAGGVQPTADISQVQILRGTQSTVVDLTGILTGDVVDDIPLVAGDQIIVPNKGTFQKNLVRPTQITPGTVELYVSNITEPGGNNLESSDDINTASFEYGTNLVQALVASECIGGTSTTNANRRALLIQTDAVSGELKTAEYSVQDLVNQVTESPDEAPLLMPNDAIACYDSGIVNARSLFDTIGNFLSPLNLLRNIFF